MCGSPASSPSSAAAYAVEVERRYLALLRAPLPQEVTA